MAPSKLESYWAMVEKARAVQAKQTMPLIGPLLDAWDEVPNDIKSLIEEQAPSLANHLDKVAEAMCADISDEI